MNQPNEGMRERFDENWYNSVSNDDSGWLYRIQAEGAHLDGEIKHFINQEIDLALAKQRSEILKALENHIEGIFIKREVESGSKVAYRPYAKGDRPYWGYFTQYSKGFNTALISVEKAISTINKDTKD